MSNKYYLRKVNWDQSPRKCLVCGTVFTPRSPNHKCCCKACQKEYTNAKKREEAERKRTEYISPNMKAIMEMVKDDPNYGRMQIESMPKV